VKASKDDILRRIGGIGFGAPLGRSNSGQFPSGIDYADVTYKPLGRFVARELMKSPDKSVRVLQLVESLKTPIDELLPAIKWMASKGYVTIAEQSPDGNWLLKGTESTQTAA